MTKKTDGEGGYAILLIIVLVTVIGLYVVMSEEEREEFHLPGVEFNLSGE